MSNYLDASIVRDKKRKLHPMIHRLLTCAFLLACIQTTAQRVIDRNDHLWLTYLGDHRLSDHWSFHTEAHIRQAEMGAMPQQLLIRPAVNFHLGADMMFTLGYSYYYNYRYGAYPIKAETWENNVYEQMQFTSHFGRITLQNRFRLEQRFIASMKADESSSTGYSFDGYIYQSRFRVRLMATLPLGKHMKVEPKTWFASAYDELFLNFGDSYQLDYMHQNRISGLLGYQFNKQGNLAAGYLLQTIQRPGAAAGADLMEMNNTLHIVLTYNLDFRKQKVQIPVEPAK